MDRKYIKNIKLTYTQHRVQKYKCTKFRAFFRLFQPQWVGDSGRSTEKSTKVQILHGSSSLVCLKPVERMSLLKPCLCTQEREKGIPTIPPWMLYPQCEKGNGVVDPGSSYWALSGGKLSARTSIHKDLPGAEKSVQTVRFRKMCESCPQRESSYLGNRVSYRLQIFCVY